MVSAQPPPDVEIDEALVRRLLADQFPDLVGLGIEFVANGWDNATFRLGPSSRGEYLGIRLPRRQLGVDLLRNEQRWLPVIEPLLSLPAPIPRRIGRPADDYPWPWTICEWIDGVPALEDAPSDAMLAARMLGGFLADLHVRSPLDAPDNAHRGVPLADKTTGFHSNLEHSGDLFDRPRMEAAWNELLTVDPWSRPPVWLHGDMHPLNVLVADGEVSGVIDFGDITSGDPASDLAIAWMLWPDRPDVRSVFRSMLPHDETTWERARGWALSLGLVIAVNAADRPTFGAMAAQTVEAALTS